MHTELSIRKLVEVGRAVLAQLGGDLLPMAEVLEVIAQGSTALVGQEEILREASLAELELFQVDFSVRRKLQQSGSALVREGYSDWRQVPGGMFASSAPKLMSRALDCLWAIIRAEDTGGFKNRTLGIKTVDGRPVIVTRAMQPAKSQDLVRLSRVLKKALGEDGESDYDEEMFLESDPGSDQEPSQESRPDPGLDMDEEADPGDFAAVPATGRYLQ